MERVPTPEQREAIHDRHPDILVEAGAGSGKTATTVDVMSEGTADTSMIEIGLPALGRRKIFDRKSVMLSPTSMPENMKL